MPDTAKTIFEQLNTTVTTYDSLSAFGGLQIGSKAGVATPIFSRIDFEKLMEKINASNNEPHEAEDETINIAKIGIDDFTKVELRTAKVMDCVPIKRAKKLLQLTLNDGTSVPRTVVSGIAPWYKPEDLIGHHVIVVANLNPAILCGVESCGMILAADCPNGDVKVIFADDVPEGSKIR
ncbi:Methionine--tRNA ligase [bioreactor metagenome]|uniref:Methionine--tRNA ligase n=1 Tax=bioreactor metagenome TaxID=1076179 RepID=A0A645FZP6_9ZZZZ